MDKEKLIVKVEIFYMMMQGHKLKEDMVLGLGAALQ